MCRYELTHSKYVDKLPAGKHSIKGLGRTAPTTDGHKTTEEGVVIPMGKGSSTAVDNTSLLYNEYPIHCVCVCVLCLLIGSVNAFLEARGMFVDPNFRFIVYDVSQVRIKYLLKMNFKNKW